MNCATCKLLFDTSDEHKAHYRTEYHDFNIKRKMVGLTPKSQIEFQESLNKINLNGNLLTLN